MNIMCCRISRPCVTLEVGFDYNTGAPQLVLEAANPID